ncbi:glycosyl transferase [Fragilaria crotonensis]|nr:glycosyl transferase [Fragilaria crotonensis]
MCEDRVSPRNQALPKPLRVLLVSESVPPQVNGIARRIGHYADGLKKLGCEVDLVSPPSQYAFNNPWNSTAEMMVIKPETFHSVLAQDYDIVHVVLPLNISGLWLLAACKVKRSLASSDPTAHKTALVVSWHCNLAKYTELYIPDGPARQLVVALHRMCHHNFLPILSDCILTPTRTTEPDLTKCWGQTGQCLTGMEFGSFHPDNKFTQWGQAWQMSKKNFLESTGSKYLIICVSRLAREKGIEDLLQAMEHLPSCVLWLVGDGNHRYELEQIAENSCAATRIKFWGYQKGKVLHAAYTVADIFVCPSLSETFGQTVNEALASEIKVALPRVNVFVEAYGGYVPSTAFWEPGNLESMVGTILYQLKINQLPDRSKLKSWDEACLALLNQYRSVKIPEHESLWFVFALPVWCLLTFLTSMSLYVVSAIKLVRDKDILP